MPTSNQQKLMTSGKPQLLGQRRGKLISMRQAAKFSPYSAEYLSLLARKGKLASIKISRDWLTTEEAVKAYVKKQTIKHEKMLLLLSK